jgi:hypothetical protein
MNGIGHFLRFASFLSFMGLMSVVTSVAVGSHLVWTKPRAGRGRATKTALRCQDCPNLCRTVCAILITPTRRISLRSGIRCGEAAVLLFAAIDLLLRAMFRGVVPMRGAVSVG